MKKCGQKSINAFYTGQPENGKREGREGERRTGKGEGKSREMVSGKRIAGGLVPVLSGLNLRFGGPRQ
jgi:hypothetical protein